MRKLWLGAAAVWAGFATSGMADTLAQNPYYQQMQQKMDAARAQAGKAFEAKYPQPQIENNLPESRTGVPNREAPIRSNPAPQPPVTEPPVTHAPPAPAAVPQNPAGNEPVPQKKENNGALNIYLPPSGTSNAQ